MAKLSERLRERTFESEGHAKTFISCIWNPALGAEEHEQLLAVAKERVIWGD